MQMSPRYRQGRQKKAPRQEMRENRVGIANPRGGVGSSRSTTAGIICPGTEQVGSRPHSSSSIGCENDRWPDTPATSSEFIPGSLHPWPSCSRFLEPPFCTELPPPSLPSLIGAAASRARRGPLTHRLQQLPAHMCARLQSGSPCNVESIRAESSNWFANGSANWGQAAFQVVLHREIPDMRRHLDLVYPGPARSRISRGAAGSRRPMPTNTAVMLESIEPVEFHHMPPLPREMQPS